MRDRPEAAYTVGALRVVVRVEGLNLEKLLRMAGGEGIALRYVRWMGPQTLRACVVLQERLRALAAGVSVRASVGDYLVLKHYSCQGGKY